MGAQGYARHPIKRLLQGEPFARHQLDARMQVLVRIGSGQRIPDHRAAHADANKTHHLGF